MRIDGQFGQALNLMPGKLFLFILRIQISTRQVALSLMLQLVLSKHELNFGEGRGRGEGAAFFSPIIFVVWGQRGGGVGKRGKGKKKTLLSLPSRRVLFFFFLPSSFPFPFFYFRFFRFWGAQKVKEKEGGNGERGKETN